MKRYYAYENWTARAYSAHDVTVHLHECAHCPFDADGSKTRSGAVRRERLLASAWEIRIAARRDAPGAFARAEGDRIPLLRPLPAGRGRNLSPRTRNRSFAEPGHSAGAAGTTHSGSSWRGLWTHRSSACTEGRLFGAGPRAAAENVVPLRAARATGRASEKKWGKEGIALGFVHRPVAVAAGAEPAGSQSDSARGADADLRLLVGLRAQALSEQGVAGEAAGPRSPSSPASHRGSGGRQARRMRRAAWASWREADEPARPRRSGEAAEEAGAGIPQGGGGRKEGPQGGLPAGISSKRGHWQSESGLTGVGLGQQKTPGAYHVAEAGPGCTRRTWWIGTYASRPSPTPTRSSTSWRRRSRTSV